MRHKLKPVSHKPCPMIGKLMKAIVYRLVHRFTFRLIQNVRWVGLQLDSKVNFLPLKKRVYREEIDVSRDEHSYKPAADSFLARL